MNLEFWAEALGPLAGVFVGILIGGLMQYLSERLKQMRAERDAKSAIANAQLQAEHIVKNAQLQAREEVLSARAKFEQETREHREQMQTKEERWTQREANLDRKLALLDKKEEKIEQELRKIDEDRQRLADREKELDALIQRKTDEIARIADLPREEARTLLMNRLQDELHAEAATLIRHVQQETRENAERTARDIIATAIQRYAADQAYEMTTSTVHLPNDEMKGRIIGREGRNIRALEAATGCDILIDDTPEVVVISGFDPLRREIARQALEMLIADGRIHPARIEEIIAKVQETLDERIRQAGEAAIYELGLHDVNPELMRLVGSLQFRHSYGQNVLQHSLEMAHLMAMMAGELGLDVTIAKRVGLFHDVGKAIDHKVEGSHAVIGADVLRKYNEPAIIINAVGAHHEDMAGESIYAVLAMAADAITAARPGARSETTEIYLKRLENLEKIAAGFRGVEKCFAIQAGREIRVLVEPSKIDDTEAMQLARNISKQIETTMQYPGQIKVTVIRETRCVEYAR